MRSATGFFTAKHISRKIAKNAGFFVERKHVHVETATDLKTISLSYSHNHKLATIVLNKPKKKNAFSKVMYHELDATLRMLSKKDDVKVIFLTGSGDYYSSGNDLSNFSEIMHPLTIAKQSREICYSFVDSFICCTKPIIVAVNGPAYGIAVTTLGLCDKVFASDTATFKTPFAELGQVRNVFDGILIMCSCLYFYVKVISRRAFSSGTRRVLFIHVSADHG